MQFVGPEEVNGGHGGKILLEQGIELFNRGEFFLAHEVWEDWWRATTHPEKQTSQGIVQIAVAMHHATKGNFVGARSVMERALRNLKDAPNDFQGIDMVRLRGEMQSMVRKLGSNEEIRPFQIARK